MRPTVNALFLPLSESAATDKDGVSMWHSHARLEDGTECLLVDPGAHDKLQGSEWFERVKALSDKYGLEVGCGTMDHALHVEGVGHGSQRWSQFGVVPMRCIDGTG